MPTIVSARVKTYLFLIQAAILRATHADLIQCLGRDAEYKNNETGIHVKRVRYYPKSISLAYGLNEQIANN